jgi:peptide chain release factor subunit 1
MPHREWPISFFFGSIVAQQQSSKGTMSAPRPHVLILTPIKDAARHLGLYAGLIEQLEWPHDRLSLAMLEGDSIDGTAEVARVTIDRLQHRCGRARLFRRDFGFHLPAGVPRWSPAFQLTRRSVLARARNHLLFHALDDEEWVLWIDVDVIDYPPDILIRLLGTGFDIVTPHCVQRPGGPTFDRNNWAEAGTVTLSDRRGSAAMRLSSVGGTMLLIRADLHRDGLVFPAFRYGLESRTIRPVHPVWGKGEVETEGLAAMAADMGIQCWGLPDLEIIHSSS